MKHWPSILIITISAVLMQFHSIAFWMEYAGNTGVGFSLALEVVALWLWWQRCNWLAVIASALLIGGALFQLSAPVIENIYRNDNSQKLAVMHRAEIKQLTESLSRYDQNSAERLGWSVRIDRAQSELTQARKNLKQALAPQKIETAAQLSLILFMQALALILFMIAQTIAIKKLPFTGVIKKKAIARITKGKNTNLTDFDRRVILAAEKIENLLPAFDKKKKLIAAKMNVRPADISLALKHIEKIEQKEKTVSLPALEKMEKVIQEMAA